MVTPTRSWRRAPLLLAPGAIALVSCLPDDTVIPDAPAAASGGAVATSSGGAASGASGGSSSGGSSSGGSSSGGAASGGAAGSTGSGGAASATGGSPGTGGAAPDPCASALLCETFESYADGAEPGGAWKTQKNHGAVSVVTSEKFGGQKSAKFTTEQNTGGKTAYIHLQDAPVFPVPNDTYFGRMMTRLESAPETDVHWTFIQGGGVVVGDTYHALYRYGGQHPVTNGTTFVGTQLMANYETPDSYGGTGPGSDCWDHSDKVVLPVAKWTCVEWQFDGPNDTMRFWLDGVAVDSLTMTGKGQGCVHQDATFEWKAPTFSTLDLGWESYQSDDARTLYIDDIVLSSERIGCPAAP